MRKVFLLVLALALAIPFAASAQEMMADSLTVIDQVSVDGSVTIPTIYVSRPAFVVIHIDNEGSPGPVIGYAALAVGANANTKVWIDTTQATSVLHAMLHEDTGTVGAYEFGTVEGADSPMRDADGNVLNIPFNAQIVRAHDQFVSDMGTVTIASITTDAAGWIVIHSDNGGSPGPVLGQTLVEAGTSTDVVVELAADGRTDVLFPMLHVDTGEAGVYEFGTVEGADGPVVLNGVVATFPIWTVPHIRVAPQIVVGGNDMMGNPPMLVAESVLSDGAGWLVIHNDNEGAPVPFFGFAPVVDGTNLNVMINFPADAPITSVLWPMLHVDTGEVGVYEFGTVEGADGPVRVGDQVVTFPINAAPSLVVEAQPVINGTITIAEALIDAPGWIAIHSDNGGSPGPVIGSAAINTGLNSDVVVTIDATMVGAQVFPMLHYDTGTAGAYEFGTVEGADGPVRVGDAVIVVPMEILPEA